MRKLSKLFTITVVVLTITWAVGLAAFVPTAQAVSLTSGDLIKASLPAVYYYGADGSRYVFPNEKTYMTWYSDFSSVVTVTDDELAAIPIGGNVTYRPGIKMLKIQTDPKAYAVEQNGTLRWVKTEAVASCLFGSEWTSLIDDVSDAFFVNYTVGSPVEDCADYTATDAENASPTINVDKGLAEGGEVGTGGALSISLASDSPAGQSVPGGAVTPATDVIFTKINLTAGSAAVDVSKIRVTRTGLSADADLASLKLLSGATQLDTAQTLNSSHQATFNVNRTIAANSTLVVTVMGNLAVTAGANSAEFRIGIASSTDVVSNASSVTGAPVWGNTMTAVNTNVGALTIAQSGSMPALGSTVDLNATETFFGMRLTAGSVEDVQINSFTLKTGNNSSINVGDLTEIEVINDTTGDTIATMTDTEANGDIVVDLMGDPLILEKGNTRDIIVRAKVVDGAGRVVAFDIHDGVSFMINAVGKLYGFGVALNDGGGWTVVTTGVGVGVTVNQGTVTVSKSDTSPAAGNIPIGGTEITVADFAYDLQGEDVRFGTTVVSLNVVSAVAGVSLCTVILDNVKLVDGSGDVLAGPVSPTGTVGGGVCTATFSSSYELPNGDNTVSVQLNTTSSILAGDTVNATINTALFTNVRGLTSNRVITPAPAATVITANAQTVQGPLLGVEMGATPIAGNVVAGKTGMWIAYVGLDASAGGEDIRVQNMTLSNIYQAGGVAAVAVETAYINARLINVDTGEQVGQTVQPTVVNATTNTLQFTFSGDELLVLQSQQVTLALQIDILSTAGGGVGTANEFDFDVTAIAGTGKQSATAAATSTVPTLAYSPEQVILANGSLVVNIDADTATSSQLVSGSTGNSAVSYTMEAIDEVIEVRDIYIVGVNPTGGAVATPLTFGSDVLSLDVYVDGVKTGATLSSSVTGIQLLSLSTPISVPKENSIVVMIKANMQTKSNINSGTSFAIGIANDTDLVGTGYGDGTGYGTTWVGLGTGLADGYSINATGQDSGAAIPTPTINNLGTALGLVYGGNQMSAHDGVLTVTLNSQSPSGLKVAATNQELARLNLTATGDQITIGALDLNISTTGVIVPGVATAIKSEDGGTTYWTAIAVPAAGGAIPFLPAGIATQLSVSKDTTKVVKIEGETTGLSNPDTLQASLVAGANTTSGVAWFATDKRIIGHTAPAVALIAAVYPGAIDGDGSGAWTGPATDELPLTCGAISY
ncbi:beta strand repeat-containing protein [Patescibacteria group bacterium]